MNLPRTVTAATAAVVSFVTVGTPNVTAQTQTQTAPLR